MIFSTGSSRRDCTSTGRSRGLERALRGAGGAVGRAGRAEGRDREDEGAARGCELGHRRPVGQLLMSFLRNHHSPMRKNTSDVPELEEHAPPHVGAPIAAREQIDPRVEVVRRQHVADAAERRDRVEDQRGEVETDTGEDRPERRVGHARHHERERDDPGEAPRHVGGRHEQVVEDVAGRLRAGEEARAEARSDRYRTRSTRRSSEVSTTITTATHAQKIATTNFENTRRPRATGRMSR